MSLPLRTVDFKGTCM